MKNKLKLLSIAIVGFSLIVILSLLKPYYIFMTKTLHVSLFRTIFSLTSLKTFDNQVNIAILGISGGNRTGDSPNLSDTIIVANYNFKNNQLTTISVPRDIWSDTLKDKINSAYAYGEANEPGLGGFILAKAELETIVGMPIQYAAVIDFDKFKELIDFFNGIDISVDNSFDDFAYPIGGKENDSCGHSVTKINTFLAASPAESEIWTYFPCRYEHIHFNSGLQHMDGETALKFVRSRHAQSDEGTDFAREKRQQKVIVALKNKLLTFTKRGDVTSFEKLYGLIDKLIKRDLTNQQAAIIIKDIIINGNFKQKPTELGEDFFDVPPYDPKYSSMWVLIPKDGNFATIHQYIKDQLTSK